MDLAGRPAAGGGGRRGNLRHRLIQCGESFPLVT